MTYAIEKIAKIIINIYYNGNEEKIHYWRIKHCKIEFAMKIFATFMRFKMLNLIR
jgi:hypothetical protein